MAKYYKICLLLLLLLAVITKVLAKSEPLASYDNARLWGLPGSLKGKVLLQGQGVNKAAALTLQFYKPGETTPVATFNVTSDANGEFVIEPLDAGNYVVTVKNSRTLQAAIAVTIRLSETTTANFGTLPQGDINNDNEVSMLDFSLLAEAFHTDEGNTRYNSQADFNADRLISILDFSFLSENMNRKGYKVTQNSYSELSQ